MPNIADVGIESPSRPAKRVITGKGQDTIGRADHAEAPFGRRVVLMADGHPAKGCIREPGGIALQCRHGHHLA